MHHLRHRGMARALKLGSLSYGIAFTAALSFLGTLAYTLLQKDERAVPLLAIFAGVAIVFGISSMFFGSRARCQLCQTTLVLPHKCTKHQNARKLLGSYRLRMTASIIFSDRFKCPYCGENFSTTVSEKPQSQTVREGMIHSKKSTAGRPVQSLNRSRSIPQKKQ